MKYSIYRQKKDLIDPWYSLNILYGQTIIVFERELTEEEYKKLCRPSVPKKDFVMVLSVGERLRFEGWHRGNIDKEYEKIE